jgi:hypothetical protein
VLSTAANIGWSLEEGDVVQRPDGQQPIDAKDDQDDQEQEYQTKQELAHSPSFISRSQATVPFYHKAKTA